MNTDLIVAYSAIFIALASLFVTIWQGIITRKHNRLSVKPLPDIHTQNFENKIAVLLENNGTGPLIIKSFRAIVGNDYKSNINDWMPQLPPDCYWSTWLRNFENSAVKPFESKNLLEFRLDERDALQVEYRDKIRETLSKIIIEMEYSDIYDTKMYFTPRHLSSAFGVDD